MPRVYEVARWKLEERIAWQMVGDEAIVLDLGSGQAIGLNATGSFIWPLIESVPENEIVQRLCGRFQTGPEEARADLDQFLGYLEERKLIARI